MKTLMKITVSAAVLAALPVLTFAAGKSIYGTDDRVEFYDASAGYKTLSDSVVSLWKTDKVTANGAAFDLVTRNFGDAYGLCPAERFRDQTLGAFCSGSLVGADLVMTAGHCVTSEADCKNIKMVFGYKVAAAGAAPTTSIPASEVYTCAGVVTRFKGGTGINPAGQSAGSDYALVRLDRKVTGHKPLAINRGSIAKGAKIFVIGHPVGLPLKVAASATVRDAANAGYFTTDLDTFGGNSGSPVFNVKTNKIEGILVRGDTDFVKSPEGCTTMATYEETGGRGEDVTKISELSAKIPQLKSRKAAREVVAVDSASLQQTAAPVKVRSVSFE